MRYHRGVSRAVAVALIVGLGGCAIGAGGSMVARPGGPRAREAGVALGLGAVAREGRGPRFGFAVTGELGRGERTDAPGTTAHYGLRLDVLRFPARLRRERAGAAWLVGAEMVWLDVEGYVRQAGAEVHLGIAGWHLVRERPTYVGTEVSGLIGIEGFAGYVGGRLTGVPTEQRLDDSAVIGVRLRATLLVDAMSGRMGAWR